MQDNCPIHSRRSRFVFLLAALCFGLPTVRADWPEFRGPWGDGHASAPGETKPIGLPLQWSETNNIKWKTPIPHRGWSTPVVMGGQVWLTTATVEGHDSFAICLDKDSGKDKEGKDGKEHKGTGPVAEKKPNDAIPGAGEPKKKNPAPTDVKLKDEE